MQSIASIKDIRIIHARSLAAATGRRRAHECLLFLVLQIAWALRTSMQLDKADIFIMDVATRDSGSG